MALKPNYAINPTPELDLRSNRAILPARVIAALDVGASYKGVAERLRTVGVKSQSPGLRRKQETKFGK